MWGKERFDAKLDKISVLISVVCLVHCISFPVLLLIGSSMSLLSFFSDHLLHQVLLFIVLPLSYFSLIGGYRTHGNRIMGAPALVGISCLGIGVSYHDHASVELLLTVVGSMLLASAHLFNLYLRSKFLAS